jgi:hypothetical protein
VLPTITSIPASGALDLQSLSKAQD